MTELEKTEIPVGCYRCMQIFDTRELRNKHQAKCKKQDIKCPDCHKKFEFRFKLRDHLKDEHNIISCKTCYECFQNTPNAIAAHTKKHKTVNEMRRLKHTPRDSQAKPIRSSFTIKLINHNQLKMTKTSRPVDVNNDKTGKVCKLEIQAYRAQNRALSFTAALPLINL